MKTHDCHNCGHSGLTLDKACPRCNSILHVHPSMFGPPPVIVGTETPVGVVASEEAKDEPKTDETKKVEPKKKGK